MWEVKTPCGCSVPIGEFVEGIVIAKTGINPLGKFVGKTVEFITCKQNIPLLFSLAGGGFSTAYILLTDEESTMYKIVQFSGFTFVGLSLGYSFGYLAYTYSTSSSSEPQKIDYSTSLTDTDYLYVTNLNTYSALNTSNTDLLYCPANNTLIKKFEIMMPTPKNIPKISYKPFALSADVPDYKLNPIDSSTRMKGTPKNDKMLASHEGSSIFAIGGLNYMIAGPSADKFYFSLCSTDIIDEKVGVIENFDIQLDKIVFFCTKIDIHKEMINIFHDQVDNVAITYVQVCGQEKCSAIALMGDIPLTVGDIILNELWDVVAAG